MRNDRITITNHSNVGVSATFALSLEDKIFNETSTASDVNGFFFADNNKALAAIGNLNDSSLVTDKLTDSKMTLSTAVGTLVENAPTGSVFFAFSGTPDVGKGAQMKDFTTVGTIVISFAPVG